MMPSVFNMRESSSLTSTEIVPTRIGRPLP